MVEFFASFHTPWDWLALAVTVLVVSGIIWGLGNIVVSLIMPSRRESMVFSISCTILLLAVLGDFYFVVVNYIITIIVLASILTIGVQGALWLINLFLRTFRA